MNDPKTILEIRRELWTNTFVAVAGSENTDTTEACSRYADAALLQFDARFPQKDEATKAFNGACELIAQMVNNQQSGNSLGIWEDARLFLRIHRKDLLK